MKIQGNRNIAVELLDTLKLCSKAYSCPICTEDITQETLFVTECSHMFCVSCINKITDTCPTCRSVLRHGTQKEPKEPKEPKVCPLVIEQASEIVHKVLISKYRAIPVSVPADSIPALISRVKAQLGSDFPISMCEESPGNYVIRIKKPAH
jgi:hypothetical protein